MTLVRKLSKKQSEKQKKAKKKADTLTKKKENGEIVPLKPSIKDKRAAAEEARAAKAKEKMNAAMNEIRAQVQRMPKINPKNGKKIHKKKEALKLQKARIESEKKRVISSMKEEIAKNKEIIKEYTSSSVLILNNLPLVPNLYAKLRKFIYDQGIASEDIESIHLPRHPNQKLLVNYNRQQKKLNKKKKSKTSEPNTLEDFERNGEASESAVTDADTTDGETEGGDDGAVNGNDVTAEMMAKTEKEITRSNCTAYITFTSKDAAANFLSVIRNLSNKQLASGDDMNNDASEMEPSSSLSPAHFSFFGRHVSAFPAASKDNFDPKKTLFIGGLRIGTTDEEVWSKFQEIFEGNDLVDAIRVVRDAKSLLCKGIGHIILKSRDALHFLLEYHANIALTNYEKKDEQTRDDQPQPLLRLQRLAVANSRNTPPSITNSQNNAAAARSRTLKKKKQAEIREKKADDKPQGQAASAKPQGNQKTKPLPKAVAAMKSSTWSTLSQGRSWRIDAKHVVNNSKNKKQTNKNKKAAGADKPSAVQRTRKP